MEDGNPARKRTHRRQPDCAERQALIHGDHRWPFLSLDTDRAQRLYPGLPVRTGFRLVRRCWGGGVLIARGGRLK